MAIALRPFLIEDAPQFARHLNDPQIAAWLANVPVPYFQDHARMFIEALSASEAENAAFAVINEDAPDTLLGGIGCRPRRKKRWMHWLKRIMKISPAVSAIGLPNHTGARARLPVRSHWPCRFLQKQASVNLCAP